MSFMQERSAISICNKALSRISQAPLSGSLEDPANVNKHAARECRQWYPSVVRSLLEKHHWGIASKRIALTYALANDRAVEWAYAYSVPSDMAFPVMIDMDSTPGAPQISYYRGLGYLLGEILGRPHFRLQGKTLYANAPGGVLDYVSYNITEADFTQSFEDNVVLLLAAALARSVAKDEDLAQSFEEQARQGLNLAIAQEMNMGRQRYDVGITDNERARFGVGYNSPLGYLGW